MTRRDLLHLLPCVVALPGTVEFFSTWLEAAHLPQHGVRIAPPPEPPLLRDYKPKFFSADDFEALEAFTQILIPTDETPGARDAHCAHFIDFVLQASDESGQEAQARWREALRALRDAGFHSGDTTTRAGIVEAMSRPERARGASHPAYAAYRMIKQETAFAFYTSRAGSIEALEYRGNSIHASFPACEHPEHHGV
jgi:hypothetical protein